VTEGVTEEQTKFKHKPNGSGQHGRYYRLRVMALPVATIGDRPSDPNTPVCHKLTGKYWYDRWGGGMEWTAFV